MKTAHTLSAVVRLPDVATLEYERGRLAAAIALSEHQLNVWARFSRALRRGAPAALLLLLGAGSIGLIVAMLKKHQPAAAAFGGLITLLLLYGASRLIASTLRLYNDAIDNLVVCHDGLRWRKGKEDHLALWSEITAVNVFESVQRGYQGQNWFASISIQFHWGETLVLDSEILSDFVRFANVVKARHAETIQQGQQSGVADALRGPAVS